MGTIFPGFGHHLRRGTLCPIGGGSPRLVGRYVGLRFAKFASNGNHSKIYTICPTGSYSAPSWTGSEARRDPHTTFFLLHRNLPPNCWVFFLLSFSFFAFFFFPLGGFIFLARKFRGCGDLGHGHGFGQFGLWSSRRMAQWCVGFGLEPLIFQALK